MNTIINVNGRQYDARTGKMLGMVPDMPATTPRKPKPTLPNTIAKPGVILDGFSRPKMLSNHTKAINIQNNNQKTRNISPMRGAASYNTKPVHVKTQRPNTLQRTVVTKPTKNAPIIHSTSSIAQSKVERSATGRGLLIKRIPDSRLARAKQTVKSSVIQKFNYSPISGKPILSNNLKVAKAPDSQDTTQTATGVRSLSKPKLGKSQNNNQRKVFEHPSLINATNHTNPKIKKTSSFKNILSKLQVSPKILGAVAGVFAILILGGFFMYQNVPTVAMRVAANRAGFNGRLPSDTPSGFAFRGPIHYTKDNIAVSFVSRSDDRNFVITQKPSEQTTESLLVGEVSPSKKRYQTYHDKGLTVFIYNDGNATWVDKGILYTIKDNGDLSSEQILAIAGSM